MNEIKPHKIGLQRVFLYRDSIQHSVALGEKVEGN